MRICLLTHDENTQAGWGRYSDLLITSLRKNGHDVLVLTESGGEHPILRRRLGMLFSAVRAIRYFRQSDVVHALDVYPFGIIAWLGNLIARKPLVLTAQGTYSIAPLKNVRTGWLARIACRSACMIIAISEYTASRVRGLVPDAKIRVINHGIDLSQYPKSDQKEVVPHRMISVGALKWRKGYHVALEAFALARQRIPDLEYRIIGSQRDAGYTSKLRKMAQELGVGDAVTFLENLSDTELQKEYSRAGLFILTSVNQGDHFEGFGLVFLEAAAHRLPVIGTTDNGISDAVSNNVNGVLVPQNDTSKTADAIVAVLIDSKKWQHMSEESYAWAQGHDIESVIHQYQEVYRDSLVS